jgi:acetoin utilization deacetylase AcuC-like enzyme
VEKLYQKNDLTRKCVSDTFEIIKENGEFHRYNPKDAKFPLEELVDRFFAQTQGTMTAVNEALQSGSSYYLGGGYHHAMSFGGRGFCLINDIVIAARWAQKEKGAKLIWIIDVDAHKGDGTAELTQNDPSLRTLSIHMNDGWPLDSQKLDQTGNLNPWFISSDIDIGISQNEEFKYLESLEHGLNRLEALDQQTPDLAIIVQGSDPYEKDQLPSSNLLRLSREEMLLRDLMVYNYLHERKIPQAYVMSGGYGEFAYEIYGQFLKEVMRPNKEYN